MDLQLYRIDGANYLVDFRNIGYYKVPDAGSNGSGNGNGASADGMGTTDQATLNGLKDQAQAQTIGGVSGPFHFLEMACQLIAELANG
jgi:carbon catabolite-derepressing protein kinase